QDAAAGRAPGNHDRRVEPRARRPELGRLGRRARVQTAHEGVDSSPTSRDVCDPGADRHAARRNRQTLRRAGTLDRDPLPEQGRGRDGRRRRVPQTRRTAPLRAPRLRYARRRAARAWITGVDSMLKITSFSTIAPPLWEA